MMNKPKLHLYITCLALLSLCFASLPAPQNAAAQLPEAPGTFEKLTPIDQLAYRSVWVTTLTWSSSAGATEYEVCFDITDDNTCDSSWTSAGANLSAQITYLQANTTYYWQVRAGDGEETTEADDGEWWEFTTGGYARFHVQLRENNVIGIDWRPGNSVTMYIDDPSNGPGIDFTDTKEADANGTAFFYDLGGLQVSPGMLVTMNDGVVYKAHTVIVLAVTDVDIKADTVAGTGMAGVNLNIQYCQYNGCLWRRWATIQPDGTWQVDFSVPGAGGDEQEILDLVPGTSGEALYPDEDADHTDVNWFIAQRFDAHPSEERVEGSGWPAGAMLTIELDNPLTPAAPDFTGTTPSLANPGDPSQTWFNFDFNGQYDLQPGDSVTVTDGKTLKQQLVTGLKLGLIDPFTDVISGTAALDSYVDVQMCGPSGCAYRTELADSNGDWAANFSLAGDQPWEQITLDLLPGDNGNVRQWDGDIDSTMQNWSVRFLVSLPLMMR
jgi:hypothetical protein